MVWVYYSAQIFLLGAEFTWVYAHCRGSRRGQQRPPSAIDTDITAQNPPPQPLSQPQQQLQPHPQPQPPQEPQQHALGRR
jgi:membrane protein